MKNPGGAFASPGFPLSKIRRCSAQNGLSQSLEVREDLVGMLRRLHRRVDLGDLSFGIDQHRNAA